MPFARSLGRAYAWQYGEQWIYSRSHDDAPEHAIEVEGLNTEGQLVLEHVTGGAASVFIRGAKPARVVAGESRFNS